jgi:hypothetical protein
MENLSSVPLKGRLLALPTNIRLDRKGWPVTSHPVYYEYVYITVKSVVTLAQYRHKSSLFVNTSSLQTFVNQKVL